MDFTIFGLTKKQSAVLDNLLLYGPQTVRDVSMRIKEQRTNCYALLEQLVDQELVERDTSLPVTRYQAASPQYLRKGIIKKQEELKNANSYLTKILPELTSLHQLTTKRQGLAYFQTLKGYAAMLDDMASSTTEVLVLASHTNIERHPMAYEILQKKLAKRSQQKVNTKLIFSLATQHKRTELQDLKSKGIDARIHYEIPLIDGEIAIYNESIAFTSYDTQLRTLVVNDSLLTVTFRSIFQALWLTSLSE